MDFLIKDFKIIETTKKSDEKVIINLQDGLVFFINEIDEKLSEINELQFKILLKTKIDDLFNIIKQLKNYKTENKTIKDIYLNTYLEAYKILENKYKPFAKEAFKEFHEFWQVSRSNEINENLWKSLMPKSTIANSSSKFKKSKWEYVFELILRGKITYQDNIFKMNNIPYDNKTSLGNSIGEVLDIDGDFRPYFTDSIGFGGSKNIFVKNKLKKIEEIMSKEENKMCKYFQDKYEKIKQPK